MVTLNTIRPEEKLACVSFAIEMAQTAIGQGQGFVRPTRAIGSLSLYEWDKIAMGAISGWVAERSRQVGSRFLDEECLLATGEVPPPYELGLVALLLPALGDFVEGMGLTNKPIGEWSRDQICQFAWTCAQMVTEARARNDERPYDSGDPADVLMTADPDDPDDPADVLMAG